MKTIKDLERKLQKADYKQARLYLFCNFIALMLISAYSILMLSPTAVSYTHLDVYKRQEKERAQS